MFLSTSVFNTHTHWTQNTGFPNVADCIAAGVLQLHPSNIQACKTHLLQLVCVTKLSQNNRAAVVSLISVTGCLMLKNRRRWLRVLEPPSNSASRQCPEQVSAFPPATSLQWKAFRRAETNQSAQGCVSLWSLSTKTAFVLPAWNKTWIK